MDLYKFIYILSNIFLANIINRFMYLFYEKCRVNKYIEFCIYSAYFILVTFIFLYFGNPIITISFNIISIFLFTLMYDYVDLKKNVIVTFIIYLILFSIELSVLALTQFNRKNFYEPYKYNNILGLLSLYVILHMIDYFLLYIKKIYLKRINKIFSNKFIINFSIVTVMSIILILLNFLYNNNVLVVIVINFSVLFLNLVIFKYSEMILINIHKNFFSRIFNDKINLYKKEIEKSEFRNDLKKYISSNNYVIDGILNSKINDVDDHVKLIIDVSVDKDLKVSLNDLLIIIGNLMDNAISGVKSTLKNNDKYINIKIKYIKGTVIVNIKNSFNENTVFKSKKIFNKNREFNNYGLGLLSVKEIVEKYKGVLEVKFNKNNFETYVLIYDIKV